MRLTDRFWRALSGAPPFHGAPAAAVGTLLIELGLMYLLDDYDLLRLSVEFDAIVDALLLGTCVGGLVFVLGVVRSRYHRQARQTSLIADALTLGVLAMGFEGVLHGPLNTLTADLPKFVGGFVNASIMAVVVGLGAAWLALLRNRTAAHGHIPAAFRKIPALLCAGAVLTGVFVAAIPSLSVVNNLSAWMRVEGGSELVNLAGRQRMLSQSLGRHAYDTTESGRIALLEAADVAEREGQRVDELAREFVKRFVPDGDQASAIRNVEELAALRHRLVGDARRFAKAGDAVTREQLNPVLQADIDAYVAAMNAGVNSVQDLADGFAARQVDVIPFRLVLGFFIVLLATVGLIWPILRLLRAQEWKLEQRRREAEAATAVKAQFLANMSHELRTPLTSVLGYAALLEQQPELSPESRVIAKRVGSSGKALLATINDLLDFSSLEAGRVAIAPRPISMKDLVEDTLAMFEAQASAKGVALRARGLDLLPARISADPDRLRQILINLVGNALKFTEAGYVEVDAAYDVSKGTLEIAVNDTGPGIGEIDLAKLFLRFSQIDGSMTRKHSGTGLGLAICKGLVEAMGGHIGVKSTVGSGSTFWFSLPLQSLASATSEDECASHLAAVAGSRILIIDADAETRGLLAQMLQNAGGEATLATGGVEGLTLGSTQPFDAILVSCLIGDLGAEAVARKLREADSLNSNIPILALSDADAPDAAPGLFDARIIRPVVQGELLRVLALALDGEVPDAVAA